MKPKMMQRLRQWHRWTGMFFAPAILFFTFSGMLQTFDFHEVENGVAPPRWIAVIASLHKKQDFPKARAAKKPGAKAPNAGEAAKAIKDRAAKPAHSPFPLKVFVGLMSIGLMLSTLVGMVIALNSRVTRRSALIMLAAGTILPLALLLA